MVRLMRAPSVAGKPRGMDEEAPGAQSAKSGAFSYFSKTFFTSPTFRSTLPPTFSAVPRSSKSWFPIALPVSSLTLPTASLPNLLLYRVCLSP